MAAGTIYIDHSAPGFTRRRCGKGFMYLDHTGKKLSASEKERIENLVIPPAWEEVWIAPKPNGHVQATGKDEKGRKQFLYHPSYREQQNARKFESLVKFAETLPDIRKRAYEDLKQRDWTRTKMAALMVCLLDEGYFRIGNKAYQLENETFGLTTMRRKHLKLNSREASFVYKAKSGKMRTVTIENKKLRRLIKNCSELPGHEIFKVRDKSGQVIEANSSLVNEYLQEISGEDFTSKNFRTWGGTTLAVELYDDCRACIDENPKKKFETELVRRVAAELNNTVSVCRTYYIHPKVLAAAETGEIKIRKYTPKHPHQLDAIERTALKIISD